MARVAARQFGLVTRAQLREAGLRDGAIAHRVANGRLHRVHRGVFLVGHRAPHPRAHELAALLACGRGALLSRRSAAALWGLRATFPAVVDVMTPARQARPRAGIRVHRTRMPLHAEDLGRRHGLPATSPSRTLVDLAATLTDHELARALNELQVLFPSSPKTLPDALERAGSAPGVATLRALLATTEGPQMTRSEAERRLLALIRTAGLPRPETNARLAGYEVDTLWRSARLIAEVDGFAFHGTRAAFERDRARDADLVASGYRVLRITWRQLTDQPTAVVARVAAALALVPNI